MVRMIVIGALLLLVFAVAFAPATLVRTLLPADSGVELLQPSGTLWVGSGDLYLAGQPAGRMRWVFAPMSLLRGAPGYDIALAGPQHELSGTVTVGLSAGGISLVGRASAAFANRWLAPYDIAISGELEFQDAQVRVPYDVTSEPGAASGSLTWTGGPVNYRLAGRGYSGNLPPLVAYLGEGLETVVYPQGGQTPLLTAQILASGFVRIGVTQLLTDLAGNPWPGSHADHEVVLEVEEQLF